MKKIFCSFLVAFVVYNSQAQNLIKNPGFDSYRQGDTSIGASMWNFDFSFTNLSQANEYFINDWMGLCLTPDAYKWGACCSTGFPSNWLSRNIVPHSDSICVGGGYYGSDAIAGQNLREMIQGKLVYPLVAGHNYQFSIYVQSASLFPWNNPGPGKNVGVNSFGALFTAIPFNYLTNYPSLFTYTPQVQINQLVTDTSNWVLLTDTFIADGGEQYVSIGNFKTDANTQTQFIDSFGTFLAISYYFMDDVSLIDLDAIGIPNRNENKNTCLVFPNPANNSIKISTVANELLTVELVNMYGQVVLNKNQLNNKELNLDISQLSNGIYIVKVKNANGSIVCSNKLSILH